MLDKLNCSQKESDLTADGFSCGFVVSSDHNESDACCLAQLDSARHLLPGGIMHPCNPYQRQICLILQAQMEMVVYTTLAQLDRAWIAASTSIVQQPLSSPYSAASTTHN